MQLAVALAAILGAATGLPTPRDGDRAGHRHAAAPPSFRAPTTCPRSRGARSPPDGTSMRQLTLGVQLKERATFASFLTARNLELVAHLQHVAADTPGRRHLARRAAHRGQVAPAAGGVRGARRRASAPPIYRSRSLLPFGPGHARGRGSSSTSPATTTCRRSPGCEDWEQRLFSLWQRALERNTTLLFAARENPAHVRLRPRRISSRGWLRRRCSRCAS